MTSIDRRQGAQWGAMDSGAARTEAVFDIAPTTAPPPPARAARRRNRTPVELLAAIVTASAVLALFADAAPTGHGVADALWRALAGAIVPLAAADARRWSWFPLAGVAAVVGRGIVGFTAGVAALVLTFATAFGFARRRWIGAVIGALAVQALLRGITYSVTGVPTLVAIAATVPVLVSTLRHTSRRVRRWLLIGLLLVVVATALLTVVTAVNGLSARDRITEAIDLGDEAVAAARDGDAILAAALIGAAGEELDAVADDFSQPWAAPARFVPILGQHAGALRDLSQAGADVAADAAIVLAQLDEDALLPAPGTIDIARLEALVEPTNELRRQLGASIVAIDDIDDTWLAAPAADRIDELGDTLTAEFETVADLDDIVGVLPGMLGSEGQRRYLVVFMTPAEARAAGGFAGNWAEIVVADGRLAVVEAGRGDDITDGVGPGGATLAADIDLTAHSGFLITEVFQNIPAIIDFPTMGRAAADWFEQATGRSVDGVIGVDPDAMAGLVELSGPVTIGDRTLDAADVRDFVLRGQYIDFEDDEEGREEILEDLTFGVFDALVTGEPPSPDRLVDVLGPLAAGDRIRMISLDDTENAALASVEVTDPFPAPAGQDLLAVVSQNLGENKIDSFLERAIDYDVTIDPATGRVTGELRIRLTNTAPNSGLPGAIIGNNDLDFRPGTNRSRLEIYTPLQLVGAVVAGDAVPMVAQTHLGWNRYQRDLFIDAGQTVELIVALDGTVDTGDGYVLGIEHQPLANDDTVQIDLATTPGWKFSTTSGVDGNGSATVRPDRDLVIGVSFAPSDGT